MSFDPAPRRRYEDACGAAHGLELLGDRWTMLVLRELMLGPRRFSSLRSDLPGISARVLTQRLAELEERGVVRRVTLPPPASVQAYEATEWGLEAEPILQELGRWAARSPSHDPSLPVSAVSIILSFRTMIVPERAAGLDRRFGIEMGDQQFVGRLEGGALSFAQGADDEAEFVIRGAPENFAAVVYGGAPRELVEIEGDVAAAGEFLSLFTLPPKVGA
ncbi:winged helix-turn-helix transcriptional regulator [Sphingomicrobium nitratireducens]|uniref:winged helix-turn-helix transcriptional regulator n=1 Tax=Sphingomicrobium nitratireducens TaxID=2964666 RepID=UPI00223F345A|nr:winged helix-turn-helix transcriptional regulator [Sphingomicrobium nitratireducens]